MRFYIGWAKCLYRTWSCLWVCVCSMFHRFQLKFPPYQLGKYLVSYFYWNSQMSLSYYSIRKCFLPRSILPRFLINFISCVTCWVVVNKSGYKNLLSTLWFLTKMPKKRKKWNKPKSNSWVNFSQVEQNKLVTYQYYSFFYQCSRQLLSLLLLLGIFVTQKN